MNLNLLPSQAKFQVEKIRQKQLVSQIMIWSTIMWILVTAIAFMTNLFIGVMSKNASNQYEKAMNSYLAMKDDIRTSQQLKYQAKLVGGSLNSRFEYGKSFELIQSLFPEGITLTNYDLHKRGLFEIMGKTSGKSNVDELEKIMEGINSGQRGNLFGATMQNLAVRDGQWLFSMEVGIK